MTCNPITSVVHNLLQGHRNAPQLYAPPAAPENVLSIAFWNKMTGCFIADISTYSALALVVTCMYWVRARIKRGDLEEQYRLKAKERERDGWGTGWGNGGWGNNTEYGGDGNAANMGESTF